MPRLIQVSVRPGVGCAQAATTAEKAVSILTLNRSLRTVRGEAAGDVNAMKRDDTAQFRIDQMDGRIVPAVGHRENPLGVAGDQVVGAERHDGIVRAAPPSSAPASGCRNRRP